VVAWDKRHQVKLGLECSEGVPAQQGRIACGFVNACGRTNENWQGTKPIYWQRVEHGAGCILAQQGRSGSNRLQAAGSKQQDTMFLSRWLFFSTLFLIWETPGVQIMQCPADALACICC
jgi:hypothetical protein